MKLVESEEAAERAGKKIGISLDDLGGDLGERPSSRQQKRDRKQELDESKVPVNEDYLFDVDIRKRELSPVYWLGPAYDVRRGTWFYQGTINPDKFT